MDKYERVIHVDNYRAELPENFASLFLAVFCEPHLISMPEDTEPLRVQSRLYAEKISCPEESICTDCLPTCKEGSCVDRVVENLYLDPTTNVNVLYRNPVYVKIGSDLIRSQCEANCINRHVKDSPYSIKSITSKERYWKMQCYLTIPLINNTSIVHTYNKKLIYTQRLKLILLKLIWLLCLKLWATTGLECINTMFISVR
jgi:hypothetical protein